MPPLADVRPLTRPRRSAQALLLAVLLLPVQPWSPALAQDSSRGVGRTDLDSEPDAFPSSPSIDDIVAAHRNDLRVVGGTEATPGQWPSLVAIYLKQPSKPAFNFCGGTIVGHEWVLTAAHCAAAMKKFGNASFFVREGTIDLSAKIHHDVSVADIVANDSFNPELTLNDIALLKLSGPLRSQRQKLTGHEKSIAMLSRKPTATVAGFGLTQEGGTGSAHLRNVDVPIVDQAICRDVYGSDKITDANFCAGIKQGGRDSCQGDSGGPLFVPDHRTGEELQVGVVSWGKGCARAGYYGVYAAVGSFEDWIKARVPDALFDEQIDPSTSAGAATAAISTLTGGVTETTKPSTIAQVTIDIAQGPQVPVGSFIDIRVTSSVSGSVVVFNQNPNGRAYQLYPSRIFPAPGATPSLAHISAGQTLSIPAAAQHDQGYRFVIRPPVGVNHLRAVVLPDSARTADIIQAHADGEDIRDLSVVLDQLAAAELATRGPESILLSPVDRGSADLTYEITP